MTQLLFLIIVFSLIVAALTWAPITFSGGLSGVTVTHTETSFFEYTIPLNTTIPPNTHACITHFWLTGGNKTYIDNVWIHYYLDGEKTASIAFQPALAAGVGWNEDSTKFFKIDLKI